MAHISHEATPGVCKWKSKTAWSGESEMTSIRTEETHGCQQVEIARQGLMLWVASTWLELRFAGCLASASTRKGKDAESFTRSEGTRWVFYSSTTAALDVTPSLLWLRSSVYMSRAVSSTLPTLVYARPCSAFQRLRCPIAPNGRGESTGIARFGHLSCAARLDSI